jgi:hypothetical protein
MPTKIIGVEQYRHGDDAGLLVTPPPSTEKLRVEISENTTGTLADAWKGARRDPGGHRRIRR